MTTRLKPVPPPIWVVLRDSGEAITVAADFLDERSARKSAENRTKASPSERYTFRVVRYVLEKSDAK